MPLYARLPGIVQAVQWRGQLADLDEIQSDWQGKVEQTPGHEAVRVQTKKGPHFAFYGDWITCDRHGRLDIIQERIFRSDYEAID